MKQKIVIEIKMDSDKCRSKALKTAVEERGVTSASLDDDNKNHLVVIGDNVNTICLVNQLNKKFRCITIVSVEEVKCCPVVCINNYDQCTEGHANKVIICSKCQSSECDGKCCSSPCYIQCPPWCSCPRCYYVPYYPPYPYRVVYDSYSDCWSIN